MTQEDKSGITFKNLINQNSIISERIMIESDGYIEKKESDGIDFYHESNVTNFCTFYTAQVNRDLF